MSLNSISKKAKIGNNVIVGDYTVIKDDVEIGNNVEIGSCVLIDNGARISDSVKIHHGAAISTIPQDLKFKGEQSVLVIGENTIVREYATLNRGTEASGKTVVGKNCLIMAYSHIAHDCIVGNNVIAANCTTLGGHVIIENWVVIGGLVGIHQFVRIGQHTMIAFLGRIVKDIPPYITAGREPVKFEGLNLTGLRRRGFTSEQIQGIETAYSIIYKSGLNVSEALAKIKSEVIITGEIREIISFIESSTRGIIKG